MGKNSHYKGVDTKHPDFVLSSADTSIKVSVLPLTCAVTLGLNIVYVHCSFLCFEIHHINDSSSPSPTFIEHYEDSFSDRGDQLGLRIDISLNRVHQTGISFYFIQSV